MPQSASPDQPRERASTRILRGLGISVCVLGLIVLALELGGHFVPALSREALDPDALALSRARVEPHPYLAYVNKPGFSLDLRAEGGKQISHNSLGQRGPEISVQRPAGVFRIVCLGGSSTYGHGPSSDASTWPGRLQDLLNLAAGPAGPRFEVVNAGCQGYSTFESLINLELRLVDLQPDLVLVYHGINDMRCAIYGTPVRDNTNWRAIWPVERPSGIDRFLQRSTTYLLLRRLDPQWLAMRQNLGAYVIRDFDPSVDRYVKSEPVPSQGYDNLRRNLASIVAVARYHGARVAFATQGARVEDIAWPPGTPREGPPPTASYDVQVAGLARVQTILREVGAELDVTVIEASAGLDAAAAASRAESGAELDDIFSNDVHLTDRGADTLARLWIEGLEAAGLLPAR